ncbi:Uncharacterised protein [Mycobacterium tuberculosis]|nr:Uncharacterised protein [Mycobacterium tuberculosis]
MSELFPPSWPASFVGRVAACVGWRDRILVGIPADLVGGQAREGSRVTEFT